MNMVKTVNGMNDITCTVMHQQAHNNHEYG